MKKNLYYTEVFSRENVLKAGIYGIFYSLASYPRLVLEVFIRKNFGERYFNLASVITVAVILFLIPKISAANAWPWDSLYRHRSDGGDFWKQYLTWYLFLVAFLYFSFLRYREIRRNPSVFDFAKFSRHSGDRLPFFAKLMLLGKNDNRRKVEIIYEPAPFFLAGLLLYWMGQSLGILLIACSIIYCFSYLAAYAKGDHFVMDKIDQLLMSDQMQKSFIADEDDDDDFSEFRGRKPNGQANRERVFRTMFEGEDSDIPGNASVAS